MPALDIVVQRATFAQIDADQVALGMFSGLANCFRHFAGLARTVADAALLVADDDESGKAETPTALHHLGDAIDADQLVDEFIIAALAVTAAMLAPFSSLSSSHRTQTFLRKDRTSTRLNSSH